ncbi:MAG: adenine phosphoribosyltransferase [Actinomycetota bacterium]|nr:adenine phosphoribosyltransferase [Actinomycetota bacterium]
MTLDDISELVAERVRNVADFPLPGVLFRDLTPLFADGAAFRRVTEALIERQGGGTFDVVAGIEARGFVLAGAVAYATGVGMVPVRKAGKLPRPALSQTYELEYGSATLQVHTDAFARGHRVFVVDDVLATGGTLEATVALVERAGAAVAGLAVVLELTALAGRERLAPRPVDALARV